MFAFCGPIPRARVIEVLLARFWNSRLTSWSGALSALRSLVRYLAGHTGIPALLVAALLVVVGYRLLKRTARFAIEVCAIALVLAAASELGWLRW
jgi:hypothetical protein